MDENDDLDEKFKPIAINLNDFEPQLGQELPDEELPPMEPTLVLRLEVEADEGQRSAFSQEFNLEAIDEELFLQPEAEVEFNQAIPWSNLLSFAGARTFMNPQERSIFVDPDGSWVDLYFLKLPYAISGYGDLIWAMYQAIDLELKDGETGQILKRLRLVAPSGPLGGADA